jgi:uncharacterized membrane protein YdfJ with MMPL/SSD domain
MRISSRSCFTPPIMMLDGLGVGVDYALLIFYRYRHELTRGADRHTATRTALDSAGRTVFFAGRTVIIALLGLVALPDRAGRHATARQARLVATRIPGPPAAEGRAGAAERRLTADEICIQLNFKSGIVFL